MSGGSARPIPPILKSVGFLTQTGTPTELYSQFQTESGRSVAALQGLRNGFQEIFKRNQFAHQANESQLLDLIVAITGLPKTDQVATAILRTFQTFQSFARDVTANSDRDQATATPSTKRVVPSPPADEVRLDAQQIGLVCNINIVLPETTSIEVYNAIFKSLRGNLVR